MKRKLYLRGGKLYYLEGGRLIPKFQTGSALPQGPDTDTDNAMLAAMEPTGPEATPKPKSNFFSDKDNIGMMSTLAGTALNSFSNNRTTGDGTSGGKYVSAATRNLDNTGFSDGYNSVLNAAAKLDPTGTTQIAKGVVDAAKGASNLIKNKDQYGISQSGFQEVTGSILDPIGRMQDAINMGKKYGLGEGIKNYATFGVSGRNLLKDRVDKALDAEKREEAMMSYGNNTGNYRNDSVYAQEGARLKPQIVNEGNPNAEIEDGELVIGPPSNVKLMGDVNTSMESQHGFKVHGDKHGQDTDRDGMEGIPVQSSAENYVASDYLGVDGKKAGKNNPSVAKVMEKNLKYLHNAETNPQDRYKNNPVAIALQKKQMEQTINEAERNKFKEAIANVAKKKNFKLEDLTQLIQTEMPKQNMTPDEQLLFEAVVEMSQSQQPSVLEQVGNTNNNNNTMGFNKFMRRGGYYQQGGGMMPMGGEEQPMDESGQYMQELAGQTPGGDVNMGMGGPEMSPEVEQMFNQLPPEVQEQIMQMPPEQMEMAIISAFEQMGGGQPQPGMEGMQPGMEEQMMGGPEMAGPEMGGMPGMDAGMSIDPAAIAEQQAIMRMGGYNEYKKGGSMKPGCKVKFRAGGRMMEGTFRGYDNTGSMVID